MGQEESRMVDESTPPETLDARTVDAVAAYIKAGRAKKIVVMTGAGISTSAGIPDFRSPDTGLYANLARLNLPHPEAVFDISFFRQNPAPFYALAHELYPGKYRPTVAHSFVRLLQEKGLLLKLFTQNIDCLERAAGVDDANIVEAHGSFARHSCIDCHASFPDDRMHAAVHARQVPHCDTCGGLVKPEIVFFGEALPASFFHSRHLPGVADLCIVMGTSLSVQPFASLPAFAEAGVPRVLINKDAVGGFGSRADDVLMLGDCDDGVRLLAHHLGWADELEALWAAAAPEEAAKRESEGREAAAKSKDELISEQVDKLAADVDASLKLSSEHEQRIKDGFRKEDLKFAAQDAADAGPQVASKEEPEPKSEVPESKAEEKGGADEVKSASKPSDAVGAATASAETSKVSTDEGASGKAKENEGKEGVKDGGDASQTPVQDSKPAL